MSNKETTNTKTQDNSVLKTTYNIKFGSFMPNAFFGMCYETPMAVIKINGVEQKTKTGWLGAVNFPNPCAYEMSVHQEQLQTVMGPDIATTIIEYKDCKTKDPVALLFPNALHVFDEYEKDYRKHLNNATLKDLDYEMAIRVALVEKYKKDNQH
ncbi:MAG: hypothetical protein UIH99_03430 [Alphaproteobacteria bacterium]|nr:hypothetical protein [Alphaproteobacteria bacterium]